MYSTLLQSIAWLIALIVVTGNLNVFYVFSAEAWIFHIFSSRFHTVSGSMHRLKEGPFFSVSPEIWRDVGMTNIVKLGIDNIGPTAMRDQGFFRVGEFFLYLVCCFLLWFSFFIHRSPLMVGMRRFLTSMSSLRWTRERSGRLSMEQKTSARASFGTARIYLDGGNPGSRTASTEQPRWRSFLRSFVRSGTTIAYFKRLADCLIDGLSTKNRLINWLTDWWMDWLIDWLIDWSTDGLIDGWMDGLIDLFAYLIAFF